MSRVSEALERASIEGLKPVANPSLIQKKTRDEFLDLNKTQNANSSSKSNREAPAFDAQDLTSEPAWPLTKRLQRLVFGRGLAEVKEFPIVFQEPNSFVGEQYKILREQVKKLYNEKDNRVLVVMSPVKGDGKSTVASNLAAAVALDYEQQVLLIDADLHSPSLHNFFGINSIPGLVDYLSSSSTGDLMDYVQNTSLHGVRLLPAGRPTHLSAELLASDKMKSLLGEIAAKFPDHHVIIDTSPVLSTSDPLVLAQQVNNIVMVVRAGVTPRECLSEAIKSLGTNRVKGIILNGATVTPSSRYYYDYGQEL